MITNLDDANFDEIVTKGNRPVLVMFHAPWAGPCNLAFPDFEDASEQVDGVMFATFDLDDNPTIPERCGVRAVPLFMLFNREEVKALMVGALGVDTIVEMCLNPQIL